MTGENRIANARAEIVTAEEALRAAAALIGLDLLRDATSRTYYAVFHAARALLLLEGLQPKTHAGVERLFGEHFVAPGRVPPDDGLLLTRLHAYRQASDYAYVFVAPRATAEAELTGASAFVERARALVEGGTGS